MQVSHERQLLWTFWGRSLGYGSLPLLHNHEEKESTSYKDIEKREIGASEKLKKLFSMDLRNTGGGNQVQVVLLLGCYSIIPAHGKFFWFVCISKFPVKVVRHWQRQMISLENPST